MVGDDVVNSRQLAFFVRLLWTLLLVLPELASRRLMLVPPLPGVLESCLSDSVSCCVLLALKFEATVAALRCSCFNCIRQCNGDLYSAESSAPDQSCYLYRYLRQLLLHTKEVQCEQSRYGHAHPSAATANPDKLSRIGRCLAVLSEMLEDETPS